MTPEERFERIEANLERITERMDRMEVFLETSLHEHDSRLRKLEDMQTVLMDAQNETWQMIRKQSENIDRLIRGRGPDGHEG